MSRLIDADVLQAEYMKYHDGKRIVSVDLAPTVEPELHGTPCYKRLPEVEDIYIVLLDENQLRLNESRVTCAYWLDGKWQYDVLETYEHSMPKLVIEPLEELTVVEWMPLPENWRRGRDDV